MQRRPALFANREEAGRRLSAHLGGYREERPVVLGLARGGVMVARQVAKALAAPLDVLVVRKLGVPSQPELALGAVAPGAVWLNSEIIAVTGVSPDVLEQLIERKAAEVAARLDLFRAEHPKRQLRGRTTILVDDGIATGATMFAAVQAVRNQGAGKVVVACPTCAAETATALERIADDVVCIDRPKVFWAVGVWYLDFSEVGDEEVLALLKEARADVVNSEDADQVPDPGSLESAASHLAPGDR